MSTTSRIACKFYQQGRCLKGANCSFSHTIGTANNNNNNNSSWGSKPAFGGSAAPNEMPKYNETSLKSDLASQEKPVWDLSVYGPAKEEPNLIVGTDRSFEEDRLSYYLSRLQNGNESQFLQEREQALQVMNQQVNAIVNNPTAAIKHFNDQKSKTSSAFGGSSNTAQFEPFRSNSGFGSGGGFGNTGSAFGNNNNNSSAFGNTGSAFGAGANKQPTSAFGGSAFGGSAFGNTGNASAAPAFGSTGFVNNSAFGNMSQPSTSAFGNTGSAFGGATPNQSAFGATSSMGGFGSTPAFGAPSAAGAQPNSMMSAAPTSAFGSTTSMGQQPSAFGMPSQPSQPFGAAQPTTAFGSAAQPTTGFGAAPPTNAGFGLGFGAQPPAQQPPLNTASMDAPSEQQAFLAPIFQYKMIPEEEPPVQLR
ncbi:hypothetical protein INT44_009336 [Umbelopsis vinacea]|uniref:C3H1-type domain-containing protein n=1 Tax=Umbelopsis vinacea TaxID=44442 RepID=A0A8H7Q447_9FUNG|nr:hypothetical protein INT44_009336 [Umbelopsis vinacea]